MPTKDIDSTVNTDATVPKVGFPVTRPDFDDPQPIILNGMSSLHFVPAFIPSLSLAKLEIKATPQSRDAKKK